jgi:phosphohistidine swiveling domain-containing protein
MDSGLVNAAALSAVVPLDAVNAADAARVGGKAANLGELKKAGFKVPDGFIVLGEPGEELADALQGLGGGPLAVRSSAVAEDLADASFAGQYETFLNVQGLEQLRKAVGDCRRSASSARVASYRANRAEAAPVEIAVLVQRMVPAEAAGVAFTANPVTGDRSEVLISAVRGLGERLVSGEAQADEWVVREGKPQRRRSSEDAITADQVAAVADLARSAAAHFGRPEDVEWAFSGGELYLLQSRPMTALPSPVDWTAPRVRGFHVPPGPSYWMRNLRLGEWLPEPVTPLFEDWLLKLISRGFGRGTRSDSGLLTGIRYAVVNRWFYSTPEPDLRLGDLLTAIFRRPISMFRFASSLIKQTGDPELAERRFFARVVRRWRQQTLPKYRELVNESSAQLESAPLADVVAIVDRVGEAAGEELWALAIGGGSAWKIEVALGRFYRQYLASQVEIDVRVLLAGLSASESAVLSHAVLSADWYWPTLGESSHYGPVNPLKQRRGELIERRETAEKACRQALQERPELLPRFEVLLELAQRYARLREEQSSLLTLAWPVLRKCVLRLGTAAVASGSIDREEDAFFLSRAELVRSATGTAQETLQARIRERRDDWGRCRSLTPPLALGTMPKLLERMLGSLEVVRTERAAPEGALRGDPASPGRASGRVRIIRGPSDFDRFQEDEVLVAQLTAPAWTPLFARAAAVVTDGGSLAAHASLVAREYGIPAVVATGDATTRLSDGQLVTVDGSAGLVEIQN